MKMAAHVLISQRSALIRGAAKRALLNKATSGPINSRVQYNTFVKVADVVR